MTLATQHKTAPLVDAIGASVERAAKGAARPPGRRRALALRARSRCDHSGRIRAAPALPRRGARFGARAPHRRLSSPHPGRSRRLAARSRRRVRYQRQREGLFRPEGDRRRSASRPYGAGARGDPRRGGAAKSNVFTRSCWRFSVSCRGAAFPPCRSRSCCCRAGSRFISKRFPIGRARSSSPLLVLQALKPRPASPGAVGICRALHRTAGAGAQVADGRPPALGVGNAVRRDRSGAEGRRAVVSRFDPAARHRKSRRLRHRAPQRRDGLGAIYPAMANAVLMFDALGYPRDEPRLVQAREAIDRLLVVARR